MHPSQKNIFLFSQFLDIKKRGWKKRSCGIVCFKTILNYWFPHQKISCDEILELALKENAYLSGVGWKHKELAKLAKKFNLRGKNFDWFKKEDALAWKKFIKLLKNGPLIVSVYKNFKNTNGGHLIVVSKVDEKYVYFLEPAAREREKIKKRISIEKFKNGWKKRIIFIHP